jgi:hypothetical protein
MSTINMQSQPLEEYLDNTAKKTSTRLIEELNRLIECRQKYLRLYGAGAVASKVELSIANALQYPPNKYVLKYFVQRGMDISYTSYRVPADISRDIVTPMTIAMPATPDGASNDVALAFGYVITFSEEAPARGKQKRGAQRGNPRRIPKAEILRVKPY